MDSLKRAGRITNFGRGLSLIEIIVYLITILLFGLAVLGLFSCKSEPYTEACAQIIAQLGDLYNTTIVIYIILILMNIIAIASLKIQNKILFLVMFIYLTLTTFLIFIGMLGEFSAINFILFLMFLFLTIAMLSHFLYYNDPAASEPQLINNMQIENNYSPA